MTWGHFLKTWVWTWPEPVLLATFKMFASNVAVNWYSHLIYDQWELTFPGFLPTRFRPSTQILNLNFFSGTLGLRRSFTGMCLLMHQGSEPAFGLWMIQVKSQAEKSSKHLRSPPGESYSSFVLWDPHLGRGEVSKWTPIFSDPRQKVRRCPCAWFWLWLESFVCVPGKVLS